MPTKVRRLFEQFQPEHYNLQLTIDDQSMTFTGHVTIRGKKVGRPAERLTFHQKELQISEATIVRHDKKGDQTFAVTRINNQNSYDEVRLHTDESLYPGEYTVTMQFSGAITRPMNGIYPCFFEHDGTQKQLIATQFESHHAREAFPCIDEPEAKAIFDLTLVTPEANSKTVLANTPVTATTTSDSQVTTVFEPTPRMSTYLLAFAYGDLDYLEATTKSGTTVRTYATPDNIGHTEFALEVAVKCLDFYNEYFDIPYPLAKCDFIALPDFASGAMENWGCITFREQALLVDPKNTSLPMKQYVANVVAHELTHQWFGNLVTMKWWNDLWLNESFASWMSYLAIDELFPEWKVWEQFIVDEQSAALRLDSLENTHPIEVTINHPDEIRTIFDAISYEKGASVLLMLKDYLGADAFRDGLRHYLKKHSYQNAETHDLWASLEEVSGKPVQDFMRAWTSQAGYPIVFAGDVNGKDTILQERFYLNPKTKKADTTWPIPLLSDQLQLEQSTRSETTVDLPESLLINSGRTGFYRTAYDTTRTANLAEQVKDGELAVVDRLGILADSFEAAKAGYISTVDALKLLEAYADEDNTFVWDVMVSGLAGIRSTMRDDDVRELLKPLGRRLSAKQLARLGWDEQAGEDHFDTLLRPTILGLACVSEDPAAVAEALRRFAAMEKPEDIAPDIRGIIYGTASRHGGKAEFDKLLQLHNSSSNSEERVTLSAALTGFKQPEIIAEALQQITSTNVRLQDAAYWVAYSFGNRYARDTTWDWMVENWQWLQDNMGSDLSFYRMPNYAARNYSDESFLPTFREFFESHMSAAFERPVKQAIETIEWQAAWRQRDLDSIKQYLRGL